MPAYPSEKTSLLNSERGFILTRGSRFIKATVAAEISKLTRYFDRVIQWSPRDEDDGYLLSEIMCKKKEVCRSSAEGDPGLFDLRDEKTTRTAIFLNGNLNHHFDIQQLLLHLKNRISRTTRVIIVAYNPYLSWIYRLANLIGIRKGEQPSTFLTRTDLKNLARLSGFEAVRMNPQVYFPFSFFGLGSILNRLLSMVPGLRLLSLVEIITLRPCISEKEGQTPSLSIVIPARNEKGNIENALQRLPQFCPEIEVIFVEGHSSDGTWEEIQRVIPLYQNQFRIQAFQQTGKGKADAVRLGFSKSSCDLLTILDADLTMPPELLSRFYEAYCLGYADFINGTRLLYPMEGEAMRFLNRLGNVFFAKALSWVLGISLGDSLCGTKLLARHDYDRMVVWRKDFGEFDPFGDFELIFPAALLGMGLIDIPIRYRARTYGATNISRFRHGWMLLKMTGVGFLRIRLGLPRLGQ